MKMTSAYANKMLKQLEEEKNYWQEKERDCCTYECAEGETPVIPEYHYEEVSATLMEMNQKIATIKHALNMQNVNAQIQVGDKVMSVDTILVLMAQMNRRKAMLDYLRKIQPKERLQMRMLPGSRNAVPEYRYINFDSEVVKKDYEAVTNQIMEMQMALDHHNQTHLFDIPID